MPEGNYVMIKGSPTDPNADFLRGGQQEILQEAIDAGDITIVGEAYTDGWLPANAQRNMEQILTANDNNVDAVVASNDGTAGGVVAALTAQGMEGIPVSGQDGDHAALNRVASGTQTVSVWKDARDLGKAAGEIAVAMAVAPMMEDIPGTVSSPRRAATTMNATFLAPVPITAGQPRRSSSMQAGSPGSALPGRQRRPGALQLIQG
jgi:D-xylose transport system substrate-binding protein